MDSDSMTIATPIPSSTRAKNPGNKKKINRSAKLKQNKIHVRREQWLSQAAVKNKGCKDGEDYSSHVPPLPAEKYSKYLLEELETKRGRDQEDNGLVIHEDNYWESPTNSPTSNVSGTNFTGSSSSRSSSSSTAGYCSGNFTGEDDDDDEEEDCLDDWEAVADALAANDKQQRLNNCMDSPPQPIVQMVSPDELNSGATKLESGRLVPLASGHNRAWRADDVFRPQSLPNLSKQLSMPNPDRYCGGGSPWTRPMIPSSCPICCEDLDLTDSSFLPCLCGFRLCLFCHKRILEDDGRCPGCRKPYECKPVETEAKVAGGSLTIRLARSCSLIERS
ncbi:hypothetical protein TanjilG_29096 [Lupinus angustifolius]|uniref:RING-type domain-containing protein n=1 Tax=Lupinus angustifolius TaxID=3871 RepID=A0A1J7H0S3_LUPAN|nr:PREDICTED: uncharacterized protein LOC109361476 [Lupinus angustifolius]OIW00106.1 hypothetical protein TanjilG_29096 [Lupinus angustifolius]